MNNEPDGFYATLERLTRKWWFYLLGGYVVFVIPPYTSVPYAMPEGWNEVIMDVLGQGLSGYAAFQPFIHVAVILLIVSMVVLGNRVGRLFPVFLCAHYVVINLAQSVRIEGKYGLEILSCNLIWFLAIAVLWAWEAAVRKTDFTFCRQPLWKYWVVPLAILAFWAPSQPWNFRPIYLLTSDAGLAFCMMTPVYLAVLSFTYPYFNLPLIRIMSFIGVIIALCNFAFALSAGGNYGLYHAVIHVPLFAISLYCFVLALRISRKMTISLKEEQDASRDINRG